MSSFSEFVFALVGLYMLIMGLRGVITKKPFVFSAKVNFWLLVLLFSPSIIGLLYSSRDIFSPAKYGEYFEWSTALILLLLLLIYPVSLAYFWRQLRGYTILGVTDDSLREALYPVLKDLGLPFEDQGSSKFHLTSLNADLETNAASWMGVARLRFKQSGHQETLDSIANGLRHYFSDSYVRINKLISVIYIVFGVLSLTIVGI